MNADERGLKLLYELGRDRDDAVVGEMNVLAERGLKPERVVRLQRELVADGRDERPRREGIGTKLLKKQEEGFCGKMNKKGP